MDELLKNNLISSSQKSLISKCGYQLLYLLKTEFTGTGFVLKITGSTLNVYTIHLDNDVLTCDCPDFICCKKNSMFCKHVCFTICYIGKIHKADVFINLKLDAYSKYILLLRLMCNDYYKDGHIFSKKLADKYNLVLKAIYLNKHNRNIQVRNLDTECVICYNDLDNDIYVCRYCNNCIHTGCLKKWLEYNSICVFCRGTIIPKDLRFKHENGYINIS